MPGRRDRLAAAHLQHQHRADRHLEQVRPEPQQPADDQRQRDHRAEAPPGEPDQVGHPDRHHHPGQHPADLSDPVREGPVEGQLHDQQRGQRGDHRMVADVQQLGDQVGGDDGNVVFAVRTPGIRPRRTSDVRARR